jgi:hypothetical protein
VVFDSRKIGFPFKTAHPIFSGFLSRLKWVAEKSMAQDGPLRILLTQFCIFACKGFWS